MNNVIIPKSKMSEVEKTIKACNILANAINSIHKMGGYTTVSHPHVLIGIPLGVSDLIPVFGNMTVTEIKSLQSK